ncbi:MAG: autotransporter outer membrane beta-barrel domain-containing protein [Deltaproteobacteria bacterium]|nr:autotransporter outer membrane beta-barrel domain-containing protein [Deltaproteobacteria bacterium]
MKTLTGLLILLAALLAAASAVAAPAVAGGAPLHFSLTVQPVRANVPPLSLGITAPLPAGRNSLAPTAGIKVDTALTAGNISGGVTFMRGNALRGDSFSSWYKSSPRADLGLQPVFILPCEYLDSYTSLNMLPGMHAKTEGIAIHGGYDLSPNLQINGAFLVAKSSRISRVNEFDTTTRKTNWQLNLGGTYKFKDNLVYSVNFGYRDGGDIFKKSGVGLSQDQGHSYVVRHQLNMSF